ncbi:glycosyl transferase group 1 [Thermodesulfobium narugense DSM 14796]|uniref:Glycosyl transferase group 1 n=1 Tax=Thermodesulfobium narugense DSM 14796 TaxID=747365 RepID=M1E9K2_9BACT|nr:glycosyltransferase family 4 protein [Thermodesulfobium narugense]AEE15424.1 glycosyl transferase group 1 [Thermodesulfobium narugense DSM 14796]
MFKGTLFKSSLSRYISFRKSLKNYQEKGFATSLSKGLEKIKYEIFKAKDFWQDLRVVKINFDYSPKIPVQHKDVAFTIINKDEMHYALNLRDSFLRNNPEIDFVVVVVDLLKDIREFRLFNELVSKGIKFFFLCELLSEISCRDMHKVLWTSTKDEAKNWILPYVFEYFAYVGFKKSLYLSKNIFCLSDVRGLYDLLDDYDVIRFKESIYALKNTEANISYFHKKEISKLKYLELDDLQYTLTFYNVKKEDIVFKESSYFVNRKNQLRKLSLFEFSGFYLDDLFLFDHVSFFGSINKSYVKLINEYYNKDFFQNKRKFEELPYYFEYLPLTKIRVPLEVRKRYSEEIFKRFRNPYLPDSENVRAILSFLHPKYSSISRFARCVIESRQDLNLAFSSTGTINTAALKDILRVNYNLTYTSRIEHSSFGINIVGFFESKIGLGVQARSFFRKASSLGIPCSLFFLPVASNLRVSEEEIKNIACFNVNNLSFNNTIFFINSEDLAYLKDISSNIFRGRTSAIWNWEFDKYFDDPRAFSLVDEVMCYSDFVKGALIKAGGEKVYKFPYPFTYDWRILQHRKNLRATFGFYDSFVFMFILDFFRDFDRKRPFLLLKALSRVVRECSDVYLIFKTFQAAKYSENQVKLTKYIKELDIIDNVVFVDETTNRDGYITILNAADAYVSPHSCEGMALPLIEAMWLGKPVIATAYGGNLEFMNKDNSILLSYKFEKIGQNNSGYNPDWEWALPDEDELYSAMIKLAKDRDFARELGERARAFVMEKFSVQNFSKEMLNFFERESK